MDKRLLTIGEFAKMARVTQATLHHYDKIGLVAPSMRGEENNYRYYSLAQLSEINLIRTLQELGLSLDEIAEAKARRTPERTAALLSRQIEKIEAKLVGWIDTRKLIATMLDTILSVQNVEERAITIQFLHEEPILLGNQNRYAKGEDGYDALARFYDFVIKTRPEIDINYPVWGLFTQKNVLQKMEGVLTWPERYYFYTPDGLERRPAGLYAVGYARGGYGQSSSLYIRMKDYIGKHGFEVCGEAYEEYPLNEICIADHDNYLMRVMAAVRER